MVILVLSYGKVNIFRTFFMEIYLDSVKIGWLESNLSMSWDQSISIWSIDWSWFRVDNTFNWSTLHLVYQHVEHLDLASGGVDWDLCQPSALQSIDWKDENLATLAVLVGGNTSVFLQIGSSLGLVLVVGQPT